jgi:hypothetical protein
MLEEKPLGLEQREKKKKIRPLAKCLAPVDAFGNVARDISVKSGVSLPTSICRAFVLHALFGLVRIDFLQYLSADLRHHPATQHPHPTTYSHHRSRQDAIANLCPSSPGKYAPPIELQLALSVAVTCRDK